MQSVLVWLRFFATATTPQQRLVLPPDLLGNSLPVELKGEVLKPAVALNLEPHRIAGLHLAEYGS